MIRKGRFSESHFSRAQKIFRYSRWRVTLHPLTPQKPFHTLEKSTKRMVLRKPEE